MSSSASPEPQDRVKDQPPLLVLVAAAPVVIGAVPAMHHPPVALQLENLVVAVDQALQREYLKAILALAEEGEPPGFDLGVH